MKGANEILNTRNNKYSPFTRVGVTDLKFVQKIRTT